MTVLTIEDFLIFYIIDLIHKSLSFHINMIILQWHHFLLVIKFEDGIRQLIQIGLHFLLKMIVISVHSTFLLFSLQVRLFLKRNYLWVFFNIIYKVMIEKN